MTVTAITPLSGLSESSLSLLGGIPLLRSTVLFERIPCDEFENRFLQEFIRMVRMPRISPIKMANVLL